MTAPWRTSPGRCVISKSQCGPKIGNALQSTRICRLHHGIALDDFLVGESKSVMDLEKLE